MSINLDLNGDFLVWTLMSRLNRDISISIEISQLETKILKVSRFTFWQCRQCRSKHHGDKSRTL